MKKLRLLFSLCLAVVFGLGTAWAQTGTFPRQYEQGEVVDELTDGMEVILTPDAGDKYHPGQFFGAAANASGEVSTVWTGAPSGNSILVIEVVGDYEDGNGQVYTTYRVKNKATGFYMKHVDGGGDVEWTDEVKKAFVCTILRTAYTEQDLENKNPDFTYRAAAHSGGNNAGTVANIGVTWILTDAAPQNEDDVIYLDAYGDKATYYSYWDTNQWFICDFTETEEYRDALSSVIFDLYPSAEEITTMFPIGTTPGEYTDAAAVQALVDLYNEFDAWSQLADPASYEECAEWYARFVAARAAIEASKLRFQSGHYYVFVSVKNGSMPYVRSVPNSNGSAVGGSAVSIKLPEDLNELTADDAKYIWQLEDAGDGYFYIRHYLTGKYPLYPGNSANLISSLSDTPEEGGIFSVDVSPYTAARCFAIIPKANSGTAWNIFGPDNDARGIGYYGWVSSDAGSNWYVQEVSEDIIKGLEGAIAQKALNDKLADIFPKASSLYNKGRVYVSDQAANDGVFTAPADGFVTSGSQLWSNAPETSEAEHSSYDNLVDGDFKTYFHSAWSYSPAGVKLHTLEADLGEAQQVIAMKYAKRINTLKDNNPLTFNLYAANDTTAAGSDWTYIGGYTFTYDQSITVPGADGADPTVKATHSGMVGMDMKAPYRYIRIEVTDNIAHAGGDNANTNNNGIPYFYLSEFRVYTGKFDADASVSFSQVPEDVRTALETALEAARPQYLGGTATQEVIDQLQAAYDAFYAAFPDIARAKEAVAEAKANVAVYTNAQVIGEGIGMFPAEAKDAFDTTIADIEAAIANGMSLEAIDALVDNAKKAVADFESTLQLPEAGKVYALRGMTPDSPRLDALVTSATTDYNTALYYTVDTVADNRIDPASALNYLWKVEKASLDEGIVLRNLATGFYMDTTVVLNNGIRNAVEPIALGIRSAKTPYGLNLRVGADQESGDDLFMNFAGGRTVICAWNSASGADNSAVRFEEVNVDLDAPSEYNANWPVAAGKPNILTLPFPIYYVEDEDGSKAYTVLGEKAVTEGETTTYTLELKAIEDFDMIKAGTPFVLVAGPNTTSYRMSLEENSINEMPYAKEAVNDENSPLVGTITGILLDWNQVGLLTFRNGSASYITSEQEERPRISGNSGYIKAVSTEEVGDHFITLRRSIASGIEGTVVADKNATVDVYTVSGVQVRKAAKAGSATNGLPAGLYIVGGKKVLVK